MCIYIYVYVYVYIYVCICVYMYMCMCIYICMYMCIYIYVYVYVYIYMCVNFTNKLMFYIYDVRESLSPALDSISQNPPRLTPGFSHRHQLQHTPDPYYLSPDCPHLPQLVTLPLPLHSSHQRVVWSSVCTGRQTVHGVLPDALTFRLLTSCSLWIPWKRKSTFSLR